jgi:hypothetical protein
MMPAFWRKLKVRTKMSVAAMLLAIPLSYLASQFHLKAVKDIQTTRDENTGIEYVFRLQKMLVHLQRRRGNTATHTAFNDTSANVKKETSSARQICEDLEAVHVGHGNPFDLTTQWEDFKNKLEYLLDTPLSADREKHIALHTEVIRVLLGLQSLISERSHLDQESESASYYMAELSLKLISPLTEIAGQTRFHGSSMLLLGEGETQKLYDLHARFGIVRQCF